VFEKQKKIGQQPMMSFGTVYGFLQKLNKKCDFKLSQPNIFFFDMHNIGK